MTRQASCHPDQPLRARGLCTTCYDRHHKAGTLHAFPLERPQRSRADFIADFTMLRSEGYTLAQIAARLGMKYKAVNTAYNRAVAAGAITRGISDARGGNRFPTRRKASPAPDQATAASGPGTSPQAASMTPHGGMPGKPGSTSAPASGAGSRSAPAGRTASARSPGIRPSASPPAAITRPPRTDPDR